MAATCVASAVVKLPGCGRQGQHCCTTSLQRVERPPFTACRNCRTQNSKPCLLLVSALLVRKCGAIGKRQKKKKKRPLETPSLDLDMHRHCGKRQRMPLVATLHDVCVQPPRRKIEGHRPIRFVQHNSVRPTHPPTLVSAKNCMTSVLSLSRVTPTVSFTVAQSPDPSPTFSAVTCHQKTGVLRK